MVIRNLSSSGNNKILLFITCALCITLIVLVHQLNPPASQFGSSLQIPASCFSSSRIRFHHRPHENYTTITSWDSDSDSDSDSDPACHFHRFSQSDASGLLKGSWIVVAGDSQARFITLSLVSLLVNTDNDSVKSDLFKRHSDYQMLLPRLGIKLDFVWAPFVSNLTSFLLNTASGTSRFPDVLIMGSGLWDMLHVSNDSHYADSLSLMRNALPSSLSERAPYMFWIGMPTLVNSMLNTPQKREKMNEAGYDAYERRVRQSEILRQSGGGGGSFLLLDLKTLTRKCGTTCTLDGMHYDQAVYEAAVHLMLNVLLIESHQML